MGQVTSLFVRKVLDQVDDSVDKRSLLRSLGIDPNSPIDPSFMLSDTDYYAFLESLEGVDRNISTLPLRVGASMHCDDYGAFGLAWKSAPNLRGSYARAERYARVLTSVASYELEMVDEGALMHLHRDGERRLGLCLSNEATIASIVSISRQVATINFNPVGVYFKHSAPALIADHEAYFGCPLYFESDWDALLVSTEALQTPNNLGDESISAFFETHLSTELARFEDKISLGQQVRDQISQNLSEGVPTISDMAGHFCMSARTLQRKLSEQGCTFHQLVDTSRRQLAERLLQQTEYSLAEIAFMTGFSEQSAFTRAFKRWAGQTPRSFRIKA